MRYLPSVWPLNTIDLKYIFSVHRFFAPALDPGATAVTLPEDDAHHLKHVLRLSAGADVGIFNGRGGEWVGRVASVTKNAVTVSGLRAVAAIAEPPVRVTLAVGVLKGDQMDAVVRDATMLGAAAIVPMTSDHVVVPARTGLSRAHGRWQRVAVASARQCGRAFVPAVAPLAPFDDLIGDAAHELKVMCVEPARAGGGLPLEAPPASALLLVGPEGGWSARELERAAAHGAKLIHLGPRTLRAETAPVVALSALWMAWGW